MINPIPCHPNIQPSDPKCTVWGMVGVNIVFPNDVGYRAASWHSYQTRTQNLCSFLFLECLGKRRIETSVISLSLFIGFLLKDPQELEISQRHLLSATKRKCHKLWKEQLLSVSPKEPFTFPWLGLAQMLCTILAGLAFSVQQQRPGRAQDRLTWE